MKHLQLGQPAPLFELPLAEGGTYSLEKDLTERPGWRYIVFFRGAWCGVCNQDLKELEANTSYFEERGVYFTALSMDNKEDSAAMKQEHSLSFPVLADASRDLLEQYGVHYHREDAPYEDHGAHGETAHYLLDEKGNVLYQQQQTSPYGRPSAVELRKIVQYIKKKLK
ncbi:peroxiredoxin [Planococcus salinarum]|uniref:thioredoxin-dependent peroxiredoxin n=1 Tax=Planococcus salinarum TaxID=622695 RepID=A0ABX3D1E8_9BACL|nr:peroxiredoxin family protein [Planococcus salinarum]OHX51132.1 peroxiredoxin [Planococcus salinarum]TAA73448.1 peroxiredoxin family protein [Planococcus salinarum]